MRVRLVGCGLAAAVMTIVGGTHPAKSQEPPLGTVYIFTQAICLPPPSAAGSPQPAPAQEIVECMTQTVPVGASIQVQLPGTPSTWVVGIQRNLVKTYADPVARFRVIPNPLRIPGTSDLYVSEYLMAVDPGEASLVVVESPPFLARPDGLLRFNFRIPP